MKTERQIANAANRASLLASNAASAHQTEFFAADEQAMRAERGNAANAAAFAAQALAHLENGDYVRFLTNVRLAGHFAGDATKAELKRQPSSRPTWQPRD